MARPSADAPRRHRGRPARQHRHPRRPGRSGTDVLPRGLLIDAETPTSPATWWLAVCESCPATKTSASSLLRSARRLRVNRTSAASQLIEREFHSCRLVHTDPVSIERRDSSISFAVEAVREKPVIRRCVRIDDPIVLDARLGVLVQLHDVVCSARARRYDLDDERDIGRRDPGRALIEYLRSGTTTMSGSRTLGGNDALVITSISGTASSPSGR